VLYALLIVASFFLAGCTVAGQEQAREPLRGAEKAESEGHYTEAARLYEDLIRRVPDSPLLLDHLGVLYAGLGRYPEAIAAYRKALNFDPHSASLMTNLGLA
jgi:Flp pilus assembly protein TadD